jgi:predicted O-methyltransferase YrrM
MTPLCALSRKYGTDKGGVMEPTPNHRANLYHDYTPIYYDLMKDWASEAWALLEVGVAEGRSARMWAEWLPNAKITGFDIDPKSLDIKENRIRTYYCDQSKQESIAKALQAVGKRQHVSLFDYIIDDGSHVRAHQIITASVLFSRLQPWGIYFIEDCINGAEPIPVPPGWYNDVRRWPDRSHSMLQIIRKCP